jgi:hypothetical protein
MKPLAPSNICILHTFSLEDGWAFMTPSLFGEIEVNILLLRLLIDRLDPKMKIIFTEKLTENDEDFDFHQLFPDLHLGIFKNFSDVKKKKITDKLKQMEQNAVTPITGNIHPFTMKYFYDKCEHFGACFP